jgi:hypothetical protein
MKEVLEFELKIANITRTKGVTSFLYHCGRRERERQGRTTEGHIRYLKKRILCCFLKSKLAFVTKCSQKIS